jgi:NAD(P)-dependent dehydrogenase (short-subunit alcohol dehydrogenase family)
MKIKNSVAFVSGANRGIGRALVEELLKAGAAKIYASARNTASLAELVADNLERVIPVSLDINKTEDIKDLADNYPDVELLINNAGIAAFAGFIAADSDGPARNEMQTNYFGTLNMTRAFAPVLKNNGGGTIVNLASIASHVNFPVLGSYSASKAAVHSLTQGTRAELAAQGTKVIGVYPGPVDTDMAASFPMDKTPPATVAKNILAAVEAGDEDVYPDPVAFDLHSGLISDPKAVEKQVGEMLPQ